MFVGVADAVRRELLALSPLPSSSTVAVETFADAEAALSAFHEPCLVIPVPAGRGESFAEQLGQLRSRFPHAPVLALYAPPVSSPDALLALGRRGVTEVLVLNGQLSRSSFRHALSQCHRDTMVRRIWRASDRVLPDPFTTLLRMMLWHAHEPLSIPRMAAIAGMHERTFRKYCETHHLPSPQWIAGWARLLVAAYYLDEPGRSAAQVSVLLQFSSPCALRNQIQRYTKLSPKVLRAGGAVRAVFEAMVDAVLAQSPLAEERSKLRLVPNSAL